MKSIYLLWHTHKDNKGNEDDKLLGIYSSKTIAQNRLKLKYNKLNGFKDNKDGYCIDKYIINKDYWEEGFITTYKFNKSKLKTIKSLLNKQ